MFRVRKVSTKPEKIKSIIILLKHFYLKLYHKGNIWTNYWQLVNRTTVCVLWFFLNLTVYDIQDYFEENKSWANLSHLGGSGLCSGNQKQCNWSQIIWMHFI